MGVSDEVMSKIRANDPGLKHLDLSQMKLNDADINVLCDALTSNTNLVSLNLSQNKIGTAGAINLAKNTTLTALNLSNNTIWADGAIALAKNPHLRKLELRQCAISATGAEALAQNKTLTSLDVSENRLGDACVQSLAKNITLTVLKLRQTFIGRLSAEALAQNTTLTELDVSNNSIGNAGAEALAKNTTLTLLKAGYSDALRAENPSSLREIKRGVSALYISEDGLMSGDVKRQGQGQGNDLQLISDNNQSGSGAFHFEMSDLDQNELSLLSEFGLGRSLNDESLLEEAALDHSPPNKRHESITFGISKKYLGSVNFQTPNPWIEHEGERTSPVALLHETARKINLVPLKDINLGAWQRDLGSPLKLSLPEFAGQMSLTFYSQSTREINTDHVIFIMAGRGENALLPPPVQGVRCVIVLTQVEFDAIKPGQNLMKSYDFLIIQSFEVNFKASILLGRLTSRRMAALLYSSHLKLKNILMMDDNIKAFCMGREDSSVTDVKGLFNALVTIQEEMDSPLVSISTISNYTGDKRFNPRELGSKVFLIDIERIEKKLTCLSDCLMLLPADETIWGEDYYLQTVLHGLFKADGVNGYGIVDPRVVQIERSTQHKNACKGTGMIAQEFAPETRKFSTIDLDGVVTQAIKTLNEGIKDHIVRFNAGQTRRENTSFANLNAARLGLSIGGVPRVELPFLIALKDKMTSLISSLSVSKKASDTSFQAHPHQIEALRFLEEHLHGDASLKLSFNIATGGGKTFIEAAIVFQAFLAGNNQNVVLVCPTINLVKQTSSALLNYAKLPFFEDCYHVIAPRIIDICTHEMSYQALNHNYSLREGGHIIVICYASFKALIKQSASSPEKTFLENTKLFIFDESHLVEKPTDMQEIEAIQQSSAHTLCFSATPKRSYASFSYTREEGIREGRLTPLIVDKSLPMDLTLPLMLNILQKHLHPENNCPLSTHKGIIYVQSIKAAQELAAHLRASDPTLDMVEIHSSASLLSGVAIERFKAAKVGIAIAVAMLKEGYDDAGVDWVLLNRKTDLSTKDQIIGRTLRLDQGKPTKIGLVLRSKEENEALTNDVDKTFPDHRQSVFYQTVKQTLNPQTAATRFVGASYCGTVVEQDRHRCAMDALIGLQNVGGAFFGSLSLSARDIQSLAPPEKPCAQRGAFHP
jgi:superfamily II DNA or RNA helicase